MNYLPLLAFVAAIAVLLLLAGRARRRQAATQAAMAGRIGVGTDVMTTSGLHGTVVARNDDDTVQLSIAPGVEVRWELAALRDAASLPPRYGAAVDRDPDAVRLDKPLGTDESGERGEPR
ncbi:preprotein translocase subunit YajC [Jatrophihabitans endophyticus]|uniref:Preprotein translocase subunit YajC n=1 Tax=Jatrophihabitans endophyticus TaxID=1206085 RepID=A0A1M5LIX4_9ACTN|nr:preprotein translocase subunit YajC [Jatrophihabitans endophyticus]SHG65094.1 preprotein translocase subunit YajC [Jatrophihabitans endophyticus]